MSHRPIEAKKRRRVAKAFKRKQLPAYFDLVEFLVRKGHAASPREARALILAGRVKSDSHVIGKGKQLVLGPLGTIEEVEVVDPHVPVAARNGVTVVPAASDEAA